MAEGIPQQIGRYTVDRLLGSGAMGYVFLARDPELGRAVAIKTLRDLQMDNDALDMFVERFRNEARAAARLHHPGIVQVYDVGESEESGPYLVLEYVAGSTLKQLLRSRGPLAPREVVALCRQVAEALDTAHAQGIIHRDIKPDNLLVTEKGESKLADFGVARLPDAALTREGQFLGTPCYAAPETLADGAYSPRSDIFSFGAVMFEVVTGSRAYPGDDAVAVAHKVLHESPPSPQEVAIDGASVPKQVAKVLLRSLARDAKDRYDTASNFAQALQAAYIEAGVLDASQALELPRPSGFPSSDGLGGADTILAHTGPVDRGRRLFTGVALALGMAMTALGVSYIWQAPVEGVDVATEVAQEPAKSPPPSQTRRVVQEAPNPAAPAGEGSALQPDDDPVAVEEPPNAALGMSRHEREEAAKNAVDQARSLVAREQWDDAKAQLDMAEQLDPGNDDIPVLRGLIPAQ